MPTGRGRTCGEQVGIFYCGIGICDRHWDQCAEEITPDDFRQRQIMQKDPEPPPDLPDLPLFRPRKW